jgi:phosphohistidine phosphatase
MNELYVVRHGVAAPHGTPGVAEDDRPLTPKGRKRMREIARGLRRLGVEPERIASSPLPRAWETAEVIADGLGLRDRLEASDALRADRDARAIRDWLEAQADARLMVVGHNPALSELLGLLVAGLTEPAICELKKGGVAALLGREQGGYSIDWIAQPRLFRRL